MPFATASDGARIHFEIGGAESGRPLMLSNSLGTTLELWERQLGALASFRLIRFDTRGHGRSDAPEGEYAMDQLGRDALAVLDATGVGATAFCGVSMGGGIGQWLAVNAPDRIERLVLANTGAIFGAPDTWRQRIEAVTTGGMDAVAHTVIERWFTPAFRERDPTEVQRVLKMLLTSPPQGYVGCCAAIRDADFRPLLGRIVAHTLVIGGTRDPATPPALAEELAAGIPGAKLLMIEAAHLSANEQPDVFNQAVIDFLR
jgi:3-oxoadipate enol-lactonase